MVQRSDPRAARAARCYTMILLEEELFLCRKISRSLPLSLIHICAKVVEMDLTRTDVSYAVTEAFRCGKIVLACATYDGFLFPPMENLLTHLKTKSFQNRTVGLMENGTWAPMAAKLMRAELESMKNITLCENVVTIRSAANAAAEAQMDALAAELVAK